jgi:excisionase family DNA binding protein
MELRELLREVLREELLLATVPDASRHNPSERKPYLTVKEAADISGLGASTVRLAIRKRELRALHVGRRVLIAERYDEFAASNKRAWADEKHILRRFAEQSGNITLSEMTTWHIEKWKSERSKQVKPGTLNRELTVIKHMFRKAIEWSLTTTNPATPIKRLPVNDQRTRFLIADEIRALLTACEKDVTSP